LALWLRCLEREPRSACCAPANAGSMTRGAQAGTSKRLLETVCG
jgi:hypothetical protein